MKKILCYMSLIFLLVFCGSLYAESRSATISFLKGTANITKKGEKKSVPAKLGLQLSGGDKIETADSTRAELKLDDGTNVRIGENTSLVIEEMLHDTENNKEKSAMKVMFGKIWMNVKKNVGQESRVITPKIIAAVKGTTYAVEVAKDGESKVNVYDGSVSVSKDGQEVLLTKLQKLTSKDLMKKEFDESSDEKDDWVRWNKSRDKLRIMVVAKEIKNKEPALVPISETVLLESFIKNYLFTVVDQSQLQNLRETEKLKAALKGDAAAAAVAGLELGADIIIVLDVSTGFSHMGSDYANLISATTNISGKIIRTDDANVLGVKMVRKAFPAANEDDAASTAIGLAGKDIAQYFMDEIVKKWKDEMRKGGSFTISCTNVSNFEKVKALEQALAGIDGAKNVSQYNYVAKRTFYTLQFVGDSASLAEKIAGLQIKGLSLDIVGLSAYKVEVEVK